MPNISICTATYNYGKYLHRVYEGLKAQTYKDFEWIIVDDGSEDDTEALVASWLDEDNFFDIRYHKFEINCGKMAAVNHGAGMAVGNWFLSFDADDELKPWALERFMKLWDSLEDSIKPEIACLLGSSEDQHGNRQGQILTEDPLICDFYERKFTYRVRGEKLYLFKTDVIRKFPYYDKVDRHVIHSATYFDIAEHYKICCINDILYVWYKHEEGKLSLSMSTRKLRFIKGRQFYAERRINKYLPLIPTKKHKAYVLKFKFFTFIVYVRYSTHMGLSFKEMYKRINRLKYRFIFCLLYPVGMGVVISDRIKKRV